MTKRFYVTKAPSGSAPGFDRFSRIEQLNDLLAQGWRIKEFVSDKDEAFFIIDKV